MLQENTSLQSLNIESNFITADGMMAIIKAMANNATLVELKIDNQVWETQSRSNPCFDKGVGSYVYMISNVFSSCNLPLKQSTKKKKKKCV